MVHGFTLYVMGYDEYRDPGPPSAKVRRYLVIADTAKLTTIDDVIGALRQTYEHFDDKFCFTGEDVFGFWGPEVEFPSWGRYLEAITEAENPAEHRLILAGIRWVHRLMPYDLPGRPCDQMYEFDDDII